MYKYLQRFFKFIGPILGTAVIQAAADTLDRAAYKGKPRHSRRYRNYPAYNQMADYARRDVAATASLYSDRRAPRTQREATMNIGKAMREAKAFDVETTGWSHEGREFHDTLLVAFDISGRDAKDVHQWLMEQMPPAGEHGDEGEIYLDAWWVANDERFDGSSTASALFVPKGTQPEARELLRKHNLFG